MAYVRSFFLSLFSFFSLFLLFDFLCANVYLLHSLLSLDLDSAADVMLMYSFDLNLNFIFFKKRNSILCCVPFSRLLDHVFL